MVRCIKDSIGSLTKRLWKNLVLWIRTRTFLGLQGPEPSLFVWIQILPSSSKKGKKKFGYYCFLTFYIWTLKTDSWKPRNKRAESSSRAGSVTPKCGSADPDPYKMSRIHNTEKISFPYPERFHIGSTLILLSWIRIRTRLSDKDPDPKAMKKPK